MADSKTKKKCSFCGRSENEVGFLITGMNGYICDSCATQAYEITQEALGEGRKRRRSYQTQLKRTAQTGRNKEIPRSVRNWTRRREAFSFGIGLQPL